MPERRTMVAIGAVVVVLAVLLTVLLTASDRSGVGRLRASLGDAAGSVGDAVSVASPTPSPTQTAAAVSQDELARSRSAAASITALLSSANAHLDRGDNANRVLALRDYERIRLSIVDVLADDGGDALYQQARLLEKRLNNEKPVTTSGPSPAGG